MEETRLAAEERFPTDEEFIAYFDWAAAPLGELKNAVQRECPTRGEFFERLRKTNYRDSKELISLDKFCRTSSFPVILIGHDKGVLYRLVPGNLLLEPEINWKDKRPMMPYNILGINLHIEPKCVAADRKSRRTHNPDSRDPENFRILHQIGTVMFYRGDYSTVKETSEGDGRRNWRETGFALVSDVTDGNPGAGYLIYDFYPFIPNLDDCSHIDNDFEWGFLPKDEENEEQFSCAKIGDSLDDLSEEYQFQWGKRYQYEVELVPAVQNPDGTLDRQIVDEPLEAAVPDLDEVTSSGYAHTESKPTTVSTPPSEKDCDSSKLASRPGSVDGRTDSEDGNTYWPSPPRSQ